MRRARPPRDRHSSPGRGAVRRQRLREHGGPRHGTSRHQGDHRRHRGALDTSPDLHPFPGVPELLSGLAPHFDVVVITSNTAGVVRDFMAREQLAGRVSDVLGVEVDASKVRKIAAVMARYPDQARYFYVGDTRGDMLEGVEAGATPLGAGWGWQGAAALEEAGAAYVAATPAELLAFVVDGARDQALIGNARPPCAALCVGRTASRRRPAAPERAELRLQGVHRQEELVDVSRERSVARPAHPVVHRRQRRFPFGRRLRTHDRGIAREPVACEVDEQHVGRDPMVQQEVEDREPVAELVVGRGPLQSAPRRASAWWPPAPARSPAWPSRVAGTRSRARRDGPLLRPAARPSRPPCA